MKTVPGFTAGASLRPARTVSRGRLLHRGGTDSLVVPAMDCHHKCVVKLVDCLVNHEGHCGQKYDSCELWCRIGPLT